jgi:hypothetical protein
LPSRTQLSDEFAASLALRGSLEAWPDGEVLGLEHEYLVQDGGSAVDFRTVVHELRLGRK